VVVPVYKHASEFLRYDMRGCGSYLYTVRARHGIECCVYPIDALNSEEVYGSAHAARAWRLARPCQE